MFSGVLIFVHVSIIGLDDDDDDDGDDGDDDANRQG